MIGTRRGLSSFLLSTDKRAERPQIILSVQTTVYASDRFHGGPGRLLYVHVFLPTAKGAGLVVILDTLFSYRSRLGQARSGQILLAQRRAATASLSYYKRTYYNVYYTEIMHQHNRAMWSDR